MSRYEGRAAPTDLALPRKAGRQDGRAQPWHRSGWAGRMIVRE
jgi:hypothetical protein